MNVFLLSMPDYFEHMPPVAVRMPNGALTSLAGNVDGHHRVAVADLILSHGRVRETVHRLFGEFEPNVVGLSVMTFQRRTALRVIDLAVELKPNVKIVVGGYDPESYPRSLRRSRGELHCARRRRNHLSRTAAGVRKRPRLETICGLSHREGGRWVHNPPRPVRRLEDGEIRLPNRAARVLRGYTLLGRPVDVVENFPWLHLRLQFLLNH